MKRIRFIVIALLLIPVMSLAQVAINTDNSSPDNSAMLDVKSTSKGILIPRMSQAQRAAISSPANGLLVYQGDGATGFYYYNGSSWQWLGGANHTGSGSPGQVTFWIGTNAISGNNGLYWDNTLSRLGVGTTSPQQQLEITGSLRLPTESNGINGVIFKGTRPFIHDYKLPGTYGENTFIGILAGSFSMTGTSLDASRNTGVGFSALDTLTTGSQNSAFGANSLRSNTTGGGNTAMGYVSLATNKTGSLNSAFGASALYNTLDTGNTAVGVLSAWGNTNGKYNTVVGTFACTNNQTGCFNAVFGGYAGYGVETNSFSNNCLFGYKSGLALTTGSNNILVGYKAGDALTLGSNNIIIGYDLDAPLATGSNQMVIGATDLLYGDLTNKRIGIGTTNPGQKLTVDGTFGIIETGGSPVYHTIFQGGNQAGDITYTLPAAVATSNGQALTSTVAGVLSWTSAPYINILRDADNDTKIQVEETADEDIIRFSTGGTERWVMNGARLEPKNNGFSVLIGDSAGYNESLSNNFNIFNCLSTISK